MSNGILYGVGIGPGDPELITLKACRRIQEADVIAVPNKNKEKSVAYNIVIQALPKLIEDNSKEWLELPMPMTSDKATWEESHYEAAKKIKAFLESGKTVAFLTIGDPTVYSTYMYIHELIVREGFQAEIISGVPSFCAAAARLQTPLCLQEEELHVIPASKNLDEALSLSGTRVFMKVGSKLKDLKEELSDTDELLVVENCGTSEEKIYIGKDEAADKTSYMSLAIVKNK